MATYTNRQIGGLAFSLIGLGSLLSAAILNPWTASWVRGARAVDFADVLASYALWAAGIGVLLLALGSLVGSGRSRRFDGLAVSALMISLIVLLDRLLLAGLGLSLWVYDTELAYRNRPNKVMTLARMGRAGDQVRINRHGHHDFDFPVEKPAGELRGLLLGDSITMGEGVTREETFASRLEKRLDERGTGHRAHQMINAGVNGYTTFQELGTLKRSLVFQPDFVVLGFCMNDVTEPFVQNRDYGGTGLDYHGVLQTRSSLLGYLFNETGFGRLLQKVRSRSASRQAAVLKEAYDIRAMALEGRANPRFREAWDIVLEDLAAFDAFTRERKLPWMLLVFPYTFQLSEHEARDPQRILRDFASERGVPFVDFTEVFENLVYDDPVVLSTLRSRGYDAAQVERFYTWKIREYFLDADHLTPRGHEVVAGVLADALDRAGLLAPPAPGAEGAAR